MTKAEVSDQLAAGGLFAIPVEPNPERREGLRFLGDLAGFVAAAHALGGRCVFVATKALAEPDFAGPAEGEPAPPDLAEIEPALAPFKRHLGEDAFHTLFVQAERVRLELVLPAPWWGAFTEARGRALDALEQRRARADAEAAEGERRQTEGLLQRLRGFIADPEFLQLPTQIAMQAYAVEQAPELESLGDRALKAEIQALDAKIKAKGLRRKK